MSGRVTMEEAWICVRAADWRSVWGPLYAVDMEPHGSYTLRALARVEQAEEQLNAHGVFTRLSPHLVLPVRGGTAAEKEAMEREQWIAEMALLEVLTGFRDQGQVAQAAKP